MSYVQCDLSTASHEVLLALLDMIRTYPLPPGVCGVCLVGGNGFVDSRISPLTEDV